MDSGNISHGRVGRKLGHRLLNMLAAFQVVTCRFVVQPEIEMGVEKLAIAIGGLGVAAFRGLEDILRRGFAGEERLHLGHRHAGVAGDGDERSAGGVQAGEARRAEEMPDGVLDVVRVDGLVKLELLFAVREPFGVIVDDAALPVFGLHRRNQLDGFVEIGDGVVEFAEPEAAPSPVLVEDRGAGVECDDGVEVR